MSDLVIGEAVVVELRYARLATRGLGLVIDAVAQALLAALLLIPVGLVAREASTALTTALVAVVFVLALVVYPTTFETLTRGKSLGKYALGLRVVRDDGGPIRFRHALVRALVGAFLDFWLTSCAVALFTSLLNPRGKRLGDILAGTVVVRERAPRDPDPTPDMPAPLAGWATQLELSRLPSELALAARSYLTRFHELNETTRQAMGSNLAEQVSRYVAPLPPAGTPPWAYLAAVLAERKRRAMQELPAPAQPSAPAGSGVAGGAAVPGGAGMPPGPPAGPPAGQPAGPPAGPQPQPGAAAPTPPPAPAPPSPPSPPSRPDDGGFAPPA